MKVRATKSFSGGICMAIGEVRSITDPAALSDLMRAGYVEPVGGGDNGATSPVAAQFETEMQAENAEVTVKDGEKAISADGENGNPQTSAEESGEVLQTGRLDKADLEKMKVENLRKLAKDMGLDDSGKKADLIKRITEVEVGVSNDEDAAEGGAEAGDAV